MIKRRHIPKKERDQIRQKFGGKCAYCGEPFTTSRKMQVDHVEPFQGFWHSYYFKDGKWFKRGPKEDTEVEPCRNDNLFPSCAKCNNYKFGFSIEDFRRNIAESCRKAEERSVNFRFAKAYNLIKETGIPVVFWFEIYVRIPERV